MNQATEQPKVAILYIALGRYIVFWKDFFESCEEKLLSCEKHYFIWTDCPPEELEHGNNSRVTIIPTQKRGWPYDSLMRFDMFLQKKEEILQCDYAFFFNANMMFYNPTDLSEIAPHEWNEGLVAGAHPGLLKRKIYLKNPDEHSYERRAESTAYIPFGSGKHYVCGAFNGGTSKAFVHMCEVLKENVQKDLDNGIVACVDDESHLNAYMSQHNYLFLGITYGFPEKELKHLGRSGHKNMIKIISRQKSHPKYGGLKYLRGKRNTKMSSGEYVVLKTLKLLCGIIPVRTWRRKVKSKLL
ncbi:MAG: hypothetical protein LBU90_04475 [Bacteroidales bacterium]|jgi:hypothetical protein|nr:hypothetical protein [Bacteroidales bacterium]